MAAGRRLRTRGALPRVARPYFHLPVIHEESESSMDDGEAGAYNNPEPDGIMIMQIMASFRQRSCEVFSALRKSAPTSLPCRRVGRSRKERLRCIFVTTLLVGVFMRPYHYFGQSSASNPAVKPSPPPPSSLEKTKHRDRPKIRPDARVQMSPLGSDGKAVPMVGREPQNFSGVSDAPLFYHISPGSTGSRTLYHASCTSGFPSVHHKSFCISRTRGIRGVADNVARGVRSHYELLRLYEMAADCSSLRSKGKMRAVDGNAASENGDGNQTSAAAKRERLCHTPLREWSRDVLSHLSDVLRGGIVGLFDTPYPYLAPQLLELASEWREAPPIVAMTERDPRGWASSRSGNHGILVCRDEYSHEGLGASEFDVVGCVERAYRNASSASGGGDYSSGAQSDSDVLHFWDVFQYRSHNGEVDAAFQHGMERQMERHQELYLPMAQYTPDMFGVHSSSAKNQSKPIDEKDVANDIRDHILGGKQLQRDIDGSIESGNVENLQSKWRDCYTKSLTCRGRVNWNAKNDTLIEYYRLPKTCKASSSKAGKTMEKSSVRMIPLIPL